MLKTQQIFLKLYRCLLYVVFHNLEPHSEGLVDVKKNLNEKKNQREFLSVKIKKKISIAIKNVIGSEDTLTNKAERPSNYFFQHFHI